MSDAQKPYERQVEGFKKIILAVLHYSVGKTPAEASDHDWFEATAIATRRNLVDNWEGVNKQVDRSDRKRVYYFSMEYLIGRSLFENLTNMEMLDIAREALSSLGVDLEQIRETEPDAALGNGGLGRLAACYLETMATMDIPAYGYGIRYEHGLFKQIITDGWQQENIETWLDFGNPWEFERPEVSYSIGFGGSVEQNQDTSGEMSHCWIPNETVRAIAYDTPVVGWKQAGVNTLRLWRARTEKMLKLDLFNAGDYLGAVSDVVQAERISLVLYPADSTEAGLELRLRQEYFFVSASLQDLLVRHQQEHGGLETLPQWAAIQLNDTHPAIAVAELMRLLVDIHGLAWEQAWEITVATLAYTNHTLLPEALESWPVGLMERLLPRHMQIIYLINAYHIDSLREQGIHDFDLLRAVSLIEESNGRHVRMGNLAFLGSHSINGVSALHTELMRDTIFRDLHKLYPDRINNKTNGVSFRRWLNQANPELTEVLTSVLGDCLLNDPEHSLHKLEEHIDNRELRQRFRQQRFNNKKRLAEMVCDELGVSIDPSALFDVQIKRFHEYKRQLLNILHTVALYQDIRNDPTANRVPRVKIFSGKAAPGYRTAKLIIKLVNDVAKTINSDPTVRGMLKVVFIPDYNVSRAELIIPASDLSEQISTAGLEASGTSNMKFALNGALTIGTLDGATVEMSKRIGVENMFIFGMTAHEVEARKQQGRFDMEQEIYASPRLTDALDSIQAGFFSPGDPGRFHCLINCLRHDDRFMLCADFDAYWYAQERVEKLWCDEERWDTAAMLNIARVGWFSSDRSIRQYASDIWQIDPPAMKDAQ